ncbi:MAG TPA: XRE family transcriptional regulator [Burkholderiales bacterium]|nr:XRE family transcriptional regulator [Burkholderiales bacterium]
MTGKGTDIQGGSGEALVEVAQADARENALKVEIARRINRILIERSLAQARAARMLGLRQLHVSDLQRYRLGGFSVEHLMTLLGRLGRSHGKIGV